MRLAVILALLGVAVAVAAASAHAAKPAYACAITPNPIASAGQQLVAIDVEATGPTKAIPYLILDGSPEWTALHNDRGRVYGSLAAAFPTPGSYTARLVDARTSDPVAGVFDVIATCPYTVT